MQDEPMFAVGPWEIGVQPASRGDHPDDEARVMGTSVAMIERHYGALLDGAHAGIARRLDALEAELEKANDEKEEAQP